ncbi:MAG: ATP-binding protein, partial [Cyclobacteriaceae bacterium]|nr:ATP-binding protein [Cyclobacteriaceae bacterium]
LEKGDKAKVLIHLKSEFHTNNLNIQLRPYGEWSAAKLDKLFFDAAFQAIYLIMMVYHLILFFQNRKYGYLYFSLYMLSLYVFFMIVSGLFAEHIFFKTPIFTWYLTPFILTAPVFYWKFFDHMVPFRYWMPKLAHANDWFIAGIISMFLIEIGLMFLNVSYVFITQSIRIILLISLLYFSVSLFFVFKKGDQLARFLVYGTIIMMMAALYEAFRWDSRIAWGNISRFGQIIQIFFFSMGIGWKQRRETEGSKKLLENIVRERTEQLVFQKQFFEKILDTVPCPVSVKDKNGKYLFVNNLLVEGYSTTKNKLLGKTISDVLTIPKKDFKRLLLEEQYIIQSGEDITNEIVQNWPAWGTRQMQEIKCKIMLGSKPCVLGIMYDITRLKEIQEKLLHANAELVAKIDELQNTESRLIENEKMVAIGLLSSGLIHEIGNPINYVSGNIQPLLKDLADFQWLVESIENGRTKWKDKMVDFYATYDSLDFPFLITEVKQLLQGIQDGTGRVKTLTQNLRNFSRTEDEQFFAVNINQLLEANISLIYHTVKERISFVTDLDPALPMTLGSSGQLSQVFLNILDNAIYAIKETGEIHLSSKRIKEEIEIRVKDSGTGIASDVITKIFEPFFTTKERGKGTGLGLSMCHQIIHRHNGSISVESEPAKGTTFIIHLPVLNGDR